ncbi:hypothetical protein OV450_3930 [Actinobacteria bacterium OV450]|nr:hypothetical protein OV450_3930 [Actinobacteria bacterium OV450]
MRAAAGGARVVVNSSAGHTMTDIRRHDPHFRTGYDKWLACGQSKTANTLSVVHLDVSDATTASAFAVDYQRWPARPASATADGPMGSAPPPVPGWRRGPG